MYVRDSHSSEWRNLAFGWGNFACFQRSFNSSGGLQRTLNTSLGSKQCHLTQDMSSMQYYWYKSNLKLKFSLVWVSKFSLSSMSFSWKFTESDKFYLLNLLQSSTLGTMTQNKHKDASESCPNKLCENQFYINLFKHSRVSPKVNTESSIVISYSS